MQHVNDLKIRYLKQLSGVASFSDSWATWSNSQFGSDLTITDAKQVFDFGDRLASVFQTTGQDARSQSSLSGGGAAWECLITWYLNLIFWNTNVFVFRQNKNFVPNVINDALCVTIQNSQTNTESDIIIFSLPEPELLTSSSLDAINEHLTHRTNQSDLAVLQCKTNWNDNAQIPMLWDLIYNSTTFRIPNVSVGRSGFTPTSFRQFSYGFVTVPTQKKAITATHLNVLRVRGMTGGNYWGKSTSSGIAASVKEFPGRRFGSFFVGGVVNHINNNLSTDRSNIDQFVNLGWS